MDENTSEKDIALYARFRAGLNAAQSAGQGPALTDMAAWIEGRLSEDEARIVETGFATDNDALDIALGAHVPLQAVAVPEALLTKLQALYPGEMAAQPQPQSAAVLAFVPRQTRATAARLWLSRAAIAASLLIVSMTGLGVGVTAGQHFSATSETPRSEGVMELLNSGSLMSDDVG